MKMKLLKLLVSLAAAAGLVVFVFYTVMINRTYLDIHNSVKVRIESRFSSLPFEDFFKQSHYHYLRATKRGNFNGVTFLKDGRLMFDHLTSPIFFYDRLDELLFLNDYLNDRGTPFLYVRAPNKIKDNSLIPLAFSNNAEIAYADAFLEYLKDFGVDTLDLRAEMNKAGFDFSNGFFRGDHHWTVETSLWAFGKIGEFVNREYGFSLDEMTWNINSYNIITKERGMLGEESITVNAPYLFEDIVFIQPKFHTDFTVTDIRYYYAPRYETSGSFTEVFTPGILEENRTTFDYSDLNRVHRYFNRYENAEARENRNVLLIMDSMGIPLATHFAAAFTTVDNHYLVHYTNNRIWPAINMNDYDLVIFVLSDMIVSYEDAYPFSSDRLNLGRPGG
jgi:hypothetical protein